MGDQPDPGDCSIRLGLGTAQFGMDYGVTNAGGRVAPALVAAILHRAADAGVHLIDTAAAYGDSESLLGSLLWANHPFRIVTKLPPRAQSPDRLSDVRAMVANSLRRLRQDTVDGLLLHRATDAVGPAGETVLSTLAELNRLGVIRKVGVSVYTGAEIDVVLEHFRPDIVQLPLNALDQRLIHSGHIERLAAAGVEVHARSVFLQGLLLAEPASLPTYFSPFLPVLQRFRDRANASRGGPLRTALQFLAAVPGVDTAIVGVTSLAELDAILLAADGLGHEEADWAQHQCDDERLINPSRWPPPDSLRATKIPTA